MADNEMRKLWASLIELLKEIFERRVRAIEHGIMLVAVQRSRTPVVVDVLSYTWSPAGDRSWRPCGYLSDFAEKVQQLRTAIPRHVTFEVLAGLIGVLECRKNGRLSRFRFYSKTGGLLVVRLLAEQHAISNIEEQALVTRMGWCSLPDWTESEIEPEVTLGSTSDDLNSKRYLLQPGEVITEQQEWLM